MNIKTRAVIWYLMRKLKWCFRKPFFPWNPKMHCKFQPAIQWDCVKAIVEIARGGSPGKEGVLEIIQHVSCFSGSAAALFGTSPDPLPPVEPVDVVVTFGTNEITVDDLCDAIESLIPGEVSDAIEGVDWAVVINALLPLLMSLIAKLLK